MTVKSLILQYCRRGVTSLNPRSIQRINSPFAEIMRLNKTCRSIPQWQQVIVPKEKAVKKESLPTFSQALQWHLRIFSSRPRFPHTNIVLQSVSFERKRGVVMVGSRRGASRWRNSAVGISLKRGPAQRHFDSVFLATTIDNDNSRRRTRSTPRLIPPRNPIQWLPSAGMSDTHAAPAAQAYRLSKMLTEMQSWFLRKQAQDDPRSACVRTLCGAIALLENRMRRSNRMPETLKDWANWDIAVPS